MTNPPDKPAPHAPPPHDKDPPLAPPGSRDYVAGQPADEAEQAKVEGEHDALMKAAEEQRKKEEAKHPAPPPPPKAPDPHSKK
jgi:hypothetical protein